MKHTGAADEGRSRIALVRTDRLAAERVTVETPHTLRTLVRDLTFDAKAGQGVLIVGPSGAGKSSILRAIAGLWTNGAGTIFRPEPSEILFGLGIRAVRPIRLDGRRGGVSDSYHCRALAK